MNGLIRLSIINLTLLCIGLIGGFILVMTGISMTQTSKEMAQSAFNTLESSQALDKLADEVIKAYAMSAAAEQQSVTLDQIAKNMILVQDAATQQVSIADELKALTTDLQTNNALLERTMGNVKY